MNIRERTERNERQLLSPLAVFADEAERDRPEEECPLRTAFQRDRDRILHSSFFRRMKHKTQVYIAPRGDHYRTRMTHDICGHFHHNEQSVRIVERLEKGGKGLNLTKQVRDGILRHTGHVPAASLEGQLVKYADRIAYLCHDFDDAEAAGLLTARDLPDAVRRRFGETHSDMITAMVTDLIQSALDSRALHMSPEGDETLLTFREFMFRRVYLSPALVPDRERGYNVVQMLYKYYMDHPEAIPAEWRLLADDDSQAAVDYISGLTDNHAIALFQDLFVPRYWNL